MRRTAIALLAACSLLAACDDEPTDASPDAGFENFQPRVVSLVASPPEIEEGQKATLTATVEDQNGIEDLVAVKLADYQNDALLGTMTESKRLSPTRAEFALVLDWPALHASRPILFRLQEVRALVAEVSDKSGASAKEEGDLLLACEDWACAGHCVDTKADPKNCGGCGTACTGEERCGDGACAVGAISSCIRIVGIIDEDITTCRAFCEGIDKACAPVCGTTAPYHAGLIYSTNGGCTQQDKVATVSSCSDDFSKGDNDRFVACCCH